MRAQIKKTSKFRATGLCAGNSPVTGEFPAQEASNAENIPIWWRHHAQYILVTDTGQLWVWCLIKGLCFYTRVLVLQIIEGPFVAVRKGTFGEVSN